MRDRDNLWKFNSRDLIYGAAGALIFAVLHWVFKTFPLPLPFNQQLFIRPSILIPLFMGLTFGGPLVGGFTGLVGHIVGDLLSAAGFNLHWAIGSGLMGLIAGLAQYWVKDYKTLRDYALAELFVLLGIWAGAAFALFVGEMLILRQSDSVAATSKLVAEGLTGTLNGALLTPALLWAWNKYRGR